MSRLFLGGKKGGETFRVVGGGYRNVGREQGKRENQGEGGKNERKREKERVHTFSWIYITVAGDEKGDEQTRGESSACTNR